MKYLQIGKYIIDTPLINIVKRIKSELHNGKLRIIQEKGDNIRVTCPDSEHKNGLEEHSSCGIYCGDDTKTTYGAYHCFACGSTGSFAKFVGLCFDKDEDFGREWLIERYGNTLIEKDLYMPEIRLKDSKVSEKMNDSFLDNYHTWHPYMAQRHLKREICELFKVKYDEESKSIVFPVYNENGDLTMLTKRSVISKFFSIDKEKEKPVYLYYYIKQNDIKEVTVCESQINTLTLWGYGIPAVGLIGTGTPHQYDVLNRSSIRHYYLALDGDEPGDKGIARFLKNIRKDVFVDIFILPRGKDVNDLTEDEFNDLLIVDSYTWIKEHPQYFDKK